MTSWLGYVFRSSYLSWGIFHEINNADWISNADLWWLVVVRLNKMLNKVQLLVSWDAMPLTHWGQVTHKCVSYQATIGSDNGLLPSRRQAIIGTNAGIFLIWPLGTKFSEILIEIHIFSFKKMHFKWSFGKWRPFCPGLNVLTYRQSNDRGPGIIVDTLNLEDRAPVDFV